MKFCDMEIELLSDLCVSDGGVYNSMLDTDVCYDRYGIPFIPAKRIRGCLRECAQELVDWGADINITVLFGDKGDAEMASSVRLGNAYLDVFQELRELAREHKDNIIMHPQNVLSTFTYVRTQTSVDQETGVAEDASLRSMRVIDKGLRFVSAVEVREDCFEQLAECCVVLRHMGIARTRGFGEVRVRLTERTGSADLKRSHAEYKEGATILRYEIDLQEPMICKSLNGEEANTMDYIEGSKVLGLIAQRIPNDWACFMNKGKLRCSNAYIAHKGVRYTEAPAYLFTVKNYQGRIINKLYERKAGRDIRDKWDKEQKNQIRHCYYTRDNGELSIRDVVTEKRYHHRRPDDKSIGRAVSGKEADFYQIDSICEGQSFAGYVEGSPQQIKAVYDILVSAGNLYMGYSRTSEYGRVILRITDVELPAAEKKVSAKRFAIRLISPAIVYSDKAMATTDPQELKKEILAALGISEAAESTNYLRFTSVGGYNTTWNKRKPIVSAFDQGTALYFESPSEVELPMSEHFWIGERTSEGYGEAVIEIISDENDEYLMDIAVEDEKKNENSFIVDDALKSRLCEPILYSFVRDHAITAVGKKEKEYIKGKKEKEYKNAESVMKPTVSNMILMAKESGSLSAVEEMVKVRYSKKSSVKIEKKKAAETILEEVKKSLKELLPEFEGKYGIQGMNPEKKSLELHYLNEYLSQIKYRLREEEKSNE